MRKTGQHVADVGRSAPQNDDRLMMPMYVAVIMVEVIVLLALWAFGRYFAS